MTGFKQWLVIGLVVLVVGFGVFFRPTNQPESVVAQPINASKTLQAVAPVQTVVAPQSRQVSPEASETASASPVPVAVPVPSAFDSLPLESQIEIRSLASRDNSDLVVEQVSPTVFRASLLGIHQIVPVAIIDPDGKVTIHEF